MPVTPKKARRVKTNKGRQAISRKLREVIQDDGASAYSLGREAGVDPGMIQRFLNEERDIRLDTLDRLADVLGLRLVETGRGRGRSSRARDGSPGVARRTRETPSDTRDTMDAGDATSSEDRP